MVTWSAMRTGRLGVWLYACMGVTVALTVLRQRAEGELLGAERGGRSIWFSEAAGA